MNRQDLFYCYSPYLHNYISKKYKLEYLCAAIHESTGRKFWLYHKSDELQKALKEYKLLFENWINILKLIIMIVI